MLPTRNPSQDKRLTQTESEGLETSTPSKWTGKKKAGITILISDKIDFQRRAIKRDPEGHFIILKGRIHQEDINIVNIYAPNIGAPKYIKKILEDFKKDIDSNTALIGDFNTPLSKMDKSSKQNINKEIVALNNVLDQMKLTDIYRAFHPKEAKYTFFSNAHGTFSKIDHMIGHKRSLNKFKKIEIISSIFSDHKELKLAINLKEKTQKHSNSWRSNSMLLNNEWVKNEIREEIKNFWKQMKMNSQQSKTYGTQRRQS